MVFGLSLLQVGLWEFLPACMLLFPCLQHWHIKFTENANSAFLCTIKHLSSPASVCFGCIGVPKRAPAITYMADAFLYCILFIYPGSVKCRNKTFSGSFSFLYKPVFNPLSKGMGNQCFIFRFIYFSIQFRMGKIC